jgi:hypothetical protein
MTMFQFKDANLSSYSFCTTTYNVFSKRTGKPMNWVKTRWDIVVTLIKKDSKYPALRGVRKTYTRTEIMRMVDEDQVATSAEKSTKIEAQPMNQSLASLSPDFAYVLFSEKNQCSQYFFANTTVQDALAKFAKRGEVIDPVDVQILNVKTGKISKLQVEIVKVFSI